MDGRSQYEIIQRAMQIGWTDEPSNDAYTNVIVPLYKLLAELVDPEDAESIRYGEIDHASGRVIAVLLTERVVYYADFRIRDHLDEDYSVADGQEVDGTYNLQIVPRSQISCITVNSIGTDARGFSESVTHADYTVAYPQLSFDVPIRSERRLRDAELALLKDLHKDLAQK